MASDSDSSSDWDPYHVARVPFPDPAAGAAAGPGTRLPRYLLGISSKMYFSHVQTITYIQSLSRTFPNPLPDLRLFFIPSFPSLLTCASFLQYQNQQHQQETQSRNPPTTQSKPVPSPTSLNSPPILLGAQDCSTALTGAHTGSVSASTLSEIGASIAELGHAERRAAPFFETDELVAEKVRAAVSAGLLPLVCVGERDHGSASASGGGMVLSENVGMAVGQVWSQVESVLLALCSTAADATPAGGGRGDMVRVVFAYEPVWAIGAEKPASPDHVVAVVREIRRRVREYALQKGFEDRLEFRVLYGGSAGPGTWEALKSELDGLFLGRFAHDVENVRLVVGEMLG